jgi:hypothetical protein
LLERAFYGMIPASVVTHGMLLALWWELEHTMSQPFKKVSGSETDTQPAPDLTPTPDHI